MQSLPYMNFVQDYWPDAWQRSILILDVMRERGNIYQEHSAKEVPHVLQFKAELVSDGRKLERPVTTRWCGSFRQPARRSIRRRRRSSSSIRALATAPALAA